MRRYRIRISDETLLRLTVIVLLLAGVSIYFAGNIFVSIPSGNVGVLWSRFFGGTITRRVYTEGMHVFFPWDRVTLYNVQAEHMPQTIETLTRDGLQVSMTLDVRYHLIIDQVGMLQRNIGPNYASTLVAPTVAAFTRSQVAHFTAEEVYSTQRSYIEQVVLDYMRLKRTVLVRKGLAEVPFINYDAIFINDIRLPSLVQSAIENKVVQQQVAGEWKYRIDRERLESERRLIRARATREVLDTLGNALTETYVRLRYVEMLEQIAHSPNSKLVVMGQQGQSVPLMTGMDGAQGKGQARLQSKAPVEAPPLSLPGPESFSVPLGLSEPP